MIYIADPAAGKLEYTREEFCRCWISTKDEGKDVGVALLLEPSPDFYEQEDEKVNIRVAGYPYLEYGFLQAKTRCISLVPNDNFYTVEVEFPKGLRSTINKEMKFSGELSGSAEIITENRSLMQRLFTPMQLLLDKYVE